MNTAHVLAWLTCLALAFFACVLSVRSAGSVLTNRKAVEQLKKQIKGNGDEQTDRLNHQVDRIQRSLQQIADELKALRKSGVTRDDSVLERDLKALEREVEELRQDMGTGGN